MLEKNSSNEEVSPFRGPRLHRSGSSSILVNGLLPFRSLFSAQSGRHGIHDGSHRLDQTPSTQKQDTQSPFHKPQLEAPGSTIATMSTPQNFFFQVINTKASLQYLVFVRVGSL
jgi:hypothetical protein